MFLPLPIELFDHIISFLAGDRDELEACTVAFKGTDLEQAVDRWLWRDIHVHTNKHMKLGRKGTRGSDRASARQRKSALTGTNQRLSPGQLLNAIEMDQNVAEYVLKLQIHLTWDERSFQAGEREVMPLLGFEPTPVLPHLGSLVVLLDHPAEEEDGIVCWSDLNYIFTSAFLKRLAWAGPPASGEDGAQGTLPLETRGFNDRGVSHLRLVGVHAFPISLLDQCGLTLKKLELEVPGDYRIETHSDSDSDVPDDLATESTTPRDSVNASLRLMHLAIHQYSGFRSLVVELTRPTPLSATLDSASITRISTLRHLSFRSNNLEDWELLPRILDACKDTLQELEIDWGKNSIFCTAVNLLPPSPISPVSPISATSSGITFTLQPTANVAILGQLPPPPPTLASCLPLDILSALRRLTFHTYVICESKYLRTSIGENYLIRRKCKHSMMEIGEALCVLDGHLNPSPVCPELKDIGLKVTLEVQGFEPPPLVDIDFSMIAAAFDDSPNLFTTERRPLNGPLVTLTLHPALRYPPKADPTRIPFVTLIASISNNTPLMSLIRSGRVVVKGMVMERISFGEHGGIDQQYKDEERERFWRGEVGWTA